MARIEVQEETSKYAEAETWNKKGALNVGDQIDGYFVDKEEYETKYDKNLVVFVIEKEDKFYKVLGSTAIKNKFKNIPEGCHVWIEYRGFIETSRGVKKDFKIEFDETDRKA